MFESYPVSFTAELNPSFKIMEALCSAPPSDSTNEFRVVSRRVPEVDRIIYSGKCTVVLWVDGTKTVVKCAADEQYDPFDAFGAALMKRIYGSTSAAKKYIAKHKYVQQPNKKSESKES